MRYYFTWNNGRKEGPVEEADIIRWYRHTVICDGAGELSDENGNPVTLSRVLGSYAHQAQVLKELSERFRFRSPRAEKSCVRTGCMAVLWCYIAFAVLSPFVTGSAGDYDITGKPFSAIESHYKASAESSAYRIAAGEKGETEVFTFSEGGITRELAVRNGRLRALKLTFAEPVPCYRAENALDMKSTKGYRVSDSEGIRVFEKFNPSVSVVKLYKSAPDEVTHALAVFDASEDWEKFF